MMNLFASFTIVFAAVAYSSASQADTRFDQILAMHKPGQMQIPRLSEPPTDTVTFACYWRALPDDRRLVNLRVTEQTARLIDASSLSLSQLLGFASTSLVSQIASHGSGDSYLIGSGTGPSQRGFSLEVTQNKLSQLRFLNIYVNQGQDQDACYSSGLEYACVEERFEF